MSLPVIPRQWQDVTMMQKMALWQAPLILILSLEIGAFMWLFWLLSWGLSFLRRWWMQLPVVAGLIGLSVQMVPVKSADFFILMLVILLPFTWRLDEAEAEKTGQSSLSPAGLCPSIFLAGSVFIFQTQFIILLAVVAWLLSFLLWFTTALTGFRLSALSIRWLPILAGSVATAAVIVTLFTFIPRLSTGFIPSFATASQKIGLTDELSPGGMSDLLASQDVAFRAIPQSQTQPAPRYWRVYTLSRQSGDKWRRLGDNTIQSNFFLPEDASDVRYQILADSHDLAFVPIAGWPASSARASAQGYGYNQFGEALLAQGRDSRQIFINAYDNVSHIYDYPRDVSLSSANPRLQAYGRELRQRYAKDDELIAAVMTEFSDAFLYDTTVSYPSSNALDSFFFETKIGYCSYFATTLATILRAAGIDAHVVTGYMGGEWNNFGNYWLVKQSDAHAWVEARTEDGTWQRLDPTLAAMQLSTARFQGLATFGETELDGRPLIQSQERSFWDSIEIAVAFADSLNLRVTLAIMNYGDTSVGEGEAKKGEDNFALLLAAIGLAVTMIFVVIGVLRLSSGRMPGRPSEERALEKVIASYAKDRLSGETLVEYASRLAALDVRLSQKAIIIAEMIYETRFSGKPVTKEAKSVIQTKMSQLLRDIKSAKKALKS
ncbi:MAG: transglutaminaseTgpA domain-containing protein [Candidatus Puniceispirillaceae bacterium]